MNVAHNILTLLTFVEAIGKVDPLGEEDGPARSSQVLSPVHPENNQTRIVTADQYHMNVFLIYPHQKKETTQYLIIMNWGGCGQVKEPGSCLLESRRVASQLLDFSILG